MGSIKQPNHLRSAPQGNRLLGMALMAGGALAAIGLCAGIWLGIAIALKSVIALFH